MPIFRLADASFRSMAPHQSNTADVQCVGWASICYDLRMMKTRMAVLAVLLGSLLISISACAQTATGTGGLQLTAKITPTAARPEPVRQFTFYVLSKSYAAVAKEVEADDAMPSRDKFIDDLKVSPELKEWLKAHEILDLTMPGLDKALKADDVLHVPEFLLAYQRSNSGGVTNGIPKPKYKDADKTEHPEKYEKQKEQYYAALRKFIGAHPETMSGMELEMDAANPQRKWAKLEKRAAQCAKRSANKISGGQGGYGSGWTRGGFGIAAGELLGKFAESGCQRRGYPSKVGCSGGDSAGANHASGVEQLERDGRTRRFRSLK
jgi:hypothetical protein